MGPDFIAARVKRAAAAFSLALGVYVTATAAIVLVAGWVFGSAWLTYIFIGAPTMKANTAAMQILIGLALTLQLKGQGKNSRRLATALAAAAGAIGGLSLIENVWAVDFGVSQILAADTWSPYAQPGLMSAGTAVCGLVTACLTVAWGRPGRVLDCARQAGTWCVLLIVLLVLCVYLFDLSALPLAPFIDTMSVLTAVGFFGIVGAVILGDPEHGLGPAFLSERAGAIVVRRLVGPIVLAPVGLGYVIYETIEDAALSLAIMVVGCSVTLCIFAMIAARDVDKFDLERRRAIERAQEAMARSEAANKAKTRFLANLSHDLRTPLNAIIGLAESLAMGVFGDVENKRHRGYLADILRSGRSLLSLIDMLLDVAQIESGGETLQEVECKLDDLCREVIREFEPTLDNRDLTLVNAVPSDLPKLHADPIMLRRMIGNLIDNAIKFTPDGGRVAIDGGEIETGCLWLEVQDTGPGIEPSEVERLKQPFEQGEASGQVARGKPGTGLGLAIVRQFSDLHEARLFIENTELGGLKVRIVFPSGRTVGSLVRAEPA